MQVDSDDPVGRGQRQLIAPATAKTGKTAIASAVLNQRDSWKRPEQAGALHLCRVGQKGLDHRLRST